MVDSTLPGKWADDIVRLADSYEESALLAQLEAAEQDICCKSDCFVCVLATRAMLRLALEYKRGERIRVSDAK